MYVKNNANKLLLHSDINNHITMNKDSLVLLQHNLELFNKKTIYNGTTFLNFMRN